MACLTGACAYLAAAGYWINEGNEIWIAVNFFWSGVFLGAALLLDNKESVRVRLRRFGIRRALALGCAIAAFLYAGTGGYWWIRNQPILVAINVFWLLFFAVAALLLRPRNPHESERIPPSA